MVKFDSISWSLKPLKALYHGIHSSLIILTNRVFLHCFNYWLIKFDRGCPCLYVGQGETLVGVRKECADEIMSSIQRAPLGPSFGCRPSIFHFDQWVSNDACLGFRSVMRNAHPARFGPVPITATLRRGFELALPPGASGLESQSE